MITGIPIYFTSYSMPDLHRVGNLKNKNPNEAAEAGLKFSEGGDACEK